jgi:triphosphoribosyl-dephospho-CoA synthetase
MGANENGSNGNGSERLAAIDRRIAAAMQKRTAEKERLRQQKARDTERLYRTVGEACCKAAGDAEFDGPLRQVLDRVTDAKARRFLTEKGML